MSAFSLIFSLFLAFVHNFMLFFLAFCQWPLTSLFSLGFVTSCFAIFSMCSGNGNISDYIRRQQNERKWEFETGPVTGSVTILWNITKCFCHPNPMMQQKQPTKYRHKLQFMWCYNLITLHYSMCFLFYYTVAQCNIHPQLKFPVLALLSL